MADYRGIHQFLCQLFKNRTFQQSIVNKGVLTVRQVLLYLIGNHPTVLNCSLGQQWQRRAENVILFFDKLKTFVCLQRILCQR